MKLAYSSVISLASLTAIACGGGGISLEDLPGELESTVCESAVECNDFPDVQTCLDVTFFDDAEFNGLKTDVDAGIINYNEDNAGRCLELFDQLINCELILGGELVDELNETCGAIFEGTVEDGGACFENEQCAGNASCDGATCPGTEGMCVAQQEVPDAEIGESCAQADCVSGAYCDSADDTCAALVEVGGTCADFDACVEGAICDIDFQTGMGTCAALVGEGETCDPAVFFGLGNCIRTDNYCDPADTTCKVRVGVGESCDVELGNCVGYAFCDGGTCTQRPLEGDACDVDGPRQCLGDLDCVAGTCQAPEGGEYCSLEG